VTFFFLSQTHELEHNKMNFDLSRLLLVHEKTKDEQCEGNICTRRILRVHGLVGSSHMGGWVQPSPKKRKKNFFKNYLKKNL
jgi:hypothetical protein